MVQSIPIRLIKLRTVMRRRHQPCSVRSSLTRVAEPAGTIIIDPAHTFLYLTLGGGKAMRYGIGVGRQGFEWSGTENDQSQGRMAGLDSAG